MHRFPETHSSKTLASPGQNGLFLWYCAILPLLHLKNNLTQRNGTGSEQVEKLRRFDLHPSSLERVERSRNFRTHGWRTSSSECLNLRRNDVQ